MKDYLKKTKFELWEVIAITLFSSLVMSFCTGYLVYRSSCGKVTSVNGDEHLAELYKAYDEIKSNYYSSVDLGSLVDAGIKGMFSYLGDPYTTYLDKDQTDNLTDSLKGTQHGIGVLISVNDEEKKIIISKVYDNTPAMEAGLVSGDEIVKVNDKLVSESKNLKDITALIKSSDVHKYTTDNFIEVKLQDPMSEDRSTLRYSLISSLKDIYDYNKNRGYKDISIFEIGKGFFKKDNIYQEELKLAVLLSGVYTLGLDKKQVDFYIMKGIVEELLNYLGYKNRYSFVVDDNIPKELHPGVSASIVVQGEHIGILGKLMPNISKDDIYVMEINLDKLLKFRGTKMSFKEITKYPSIKKDVAFIVDKNVSAGSIEAQIKKSGGKLLSNIEVFDVYMGDNLKDNEKSLAFNLTFQDSNRTLEEDEVMIIFNKIINDVTKNCHATLRNM